MVSRFLEGVAPTQPVDEQVISAYLVWLNAGKDKSIDTEHGSLGCLGCGAPTALRAVWAIGAIETAFGLHTNAHTPKIRAYVKTLRKSWITEGSPSFDVVTVRLPHAQALPALPHACGTSAPHAPTRARIRFRLPCGTESCARAARRRVRVCERLSSATRLRDVTTRSPRASRA